MKYYTEDMGCFGIAMVIILSAICPPLFIVFILIYAFFKDNFSISKSQIFT